jgi:hypothetical protein
MNEMRTVRACAKYCHIRCIYDRIYGAYGQSYDFVDGVLTELGQLFIIIFLIIFTHQLCILNFKAFPKTKAHTSATFIDV